MQIPRCCFLLFFLAPFVVPEATAAPIKFDFRSPVIENLDGANAISLSSGNLTLRLETESGIFNRTNSAFGINASGAGDDTDEIDAGASITEILNITFNQTVRLIKIAVSKLGSNDSGTLFGMDALLLEFTVSGEHSLENYILPQSEQISLSHRSGNGFSFDALEVDTVTVDEASMLCLFTIGFVLVYAQRSWLNRIV